MPAPHPLRARPGRSLRALLLATASIATVPAWADESASSTFSLSGFGTLGVTSQSGADGWGFQRNSTQLGASSDVSFTQDSRLGVQLNWNHGTQWEGVVQGVLIRKPSGTPASESIEWAYIGYRPTPTTRVRLGRTSPDMFLFADSRNVGYALPWVRPPVDLYGFAPMVSVDGLDLEKQWLSGGDVLWRTRMMLGRFQGGISDSFGQRIPLEGRNVWSLGASRESGGLLLKINVLGTRLQAKAAPDAEALKQGLNQLAMLPVPGLAEAVQPLADNMWTEGQATYFSVAAQYETGPWTLIAEASKLRVPKSPISGLRAYASVGYRLGSVTYYGLASRVLPKDPSLQAPDLIPLLTPVLGPDGALQAQTLAGYGAAATTLYRYNQSTVGVGVRWDFASNAALKLQADHFSVHRNGAAGWRNTDSRAASGMLYSVALDFVWGQ